MTSVVSSERLRVLKIAPTPFFADRGCHVRILEQARALRASGCSVVVCTYHHGRAVAGLDIRRSLRVPWYTKLSAGPSLHKIYIDALLLATVLRCCAKVRPHVIHAHLHEGAAIGRVARALFGIPVVADLQGSLTGELAQHGFLRPGGWLHAALRAAERAILRMPDAIVASSPRAIPEDLAGPLASDAVMVPDGVDCSRFRPSAPRAGLRESVGIPADAPVIGFLGLLNAYQGVPVLLEAAKSVVAEFPSARFLIMGYPNVKLYRERAEQLGIGDNCIFTGRVRYARARRMLALCDIAVSPKLAVSEGNGKLLNYMAMGLPVVASDTQVNRDLLGPDGVHVPPGDAPALAAAIGRLLRNPEAAKAIGMKLRERAVAQFSWAGAAERLIDVYQAAIERRATRAGTLPARSST
jgi:glycosyltransferase involved in cell wall biosynthesis